jgi:hypothetical protein
MSSFSREFGFSKIIGFFCSPLEQYYGKKKKIICPYPLFADSQFIVSARVCIGAYLSGTTDRCSVSKKTGLFPIIHHERT